MSFLASVRRSCDTKNRQTLAVSHSAHESAELKMAKKQRHYVFKLQQLSKKLASSTETAQNDLPSRSSPRRLDEAAKSEVNDNDIKELITNKLKEDRQIRYRNKLKALGQLLRESEMSCDPSNSRETYSPCVSSDIIIEHSPDNIVKITDSKRFGLRELCTCCYSMETYVEDVFSADDDIEQLLLQEALDETILSDEWTLDVSSTPSGQTKRGTDTTDAAVRFVNGKGSPRNTVLFQGDPCEI